MSQYEPPDMENMTMQEQAALLHELYTSLRKEGFTKAEAMHILLHIPCCRECR